MSFLDQFLKESSLRRTASADSEEGDIEDNRAPSVLSSNKSVTSDHTSQHPSHSAVPPIEHRIAQVT